MSEQRDEAADIEQRYVQGEVETERIVEGLDPQQTSQDAVDRVEAVGDDIEDDVETMAREDRSAQ